MKFNGKSILEYVVSFSKIITVVWLAIWVETILFSQLAIILNFGDVTAIQYINDNVIQIGLIICGFYFSTKCIENVAKGIEATFKAKNEIEEQDEELSDQTEVNEDEIILSEEEEVNTDEL